MQAFEIVARRWHAANRERTEPSRRSSPALRRKGAFRFSTCQSSWFAASWFAARAVARASAHARTKITCTARHPCAWHCAPIRYVTKVQGPRPSRSETEQKARRTETRGSDNQRTTGGFFHRGDQRRQHLALFLPVNFWLLLYVWRRACVGPFASGPGVLSALRCPDPKQTEPLKV